MTDQATAGASVHNDMKAAAAELAHLVDLGMPTGVLELADSLLGGLPLPSSPGAPAGTEQSLAWLLLAPRRLDPDWPSTNPPVAVGDSWIHLEVVDADLPILEALRDQHRSEDGEAFSSRCQTMRLPVCPYRKPNSDPPPPNRPRTNTTNTTDTTSKTSTTADAVDRSRFADLTGKLVVDMTSHWAGPLGTKLLSEAGATVVKIDPDCRPDGFRDRPAVYEHLNSGKDIVGYDLRLEPERIRFEKLLASADLLVESFSRRVMTNLGYGWPELKRLSPGLSLLSVKAFPATGEHADWLAYGPGVHAAAGLASWSDGPVDTQQDGGQIKPVPIQTPVAYPDFLTGIAAYANASSQLSGDKGDGGTRNEVAMSDVISPLRATDHGDSAMNQDTMR